MKLINTLTHVAGHITENYNPWSQFLSHINYCCLTPLDYAFLLSSMMDPLDHLFHKDRDPLSSRSTLAEAWTHLGSNLGSLPRKVNKAQLFTRGMAAVSRLESFEAIFFH